MRGLITCPIARPIELPSFLRSTWVMALNISSRARTVSLPLCRVISPGRGLVPGELDCQGGAVIGARQRSLTSGVLPLTARGGPVRPRPQNTNILPLYQFHQRRGMSDVKRGRR
jgi:hypothetical protein